MWYILAAFLPVLFVLVVINSLMGALVGMGGAL